jgi:hypothetical protein
MSTASNANTTSIAITKMLRSDMTYHLLSVVSGLRWKPEGEIKVFHLGRFLCSTKINVST